jgi:hypothetical protein
MLKTEIKKERGLKFDQVLKLLNSLCGRANCTVKTRGINGI